ncbi:hypothetical protein AHiyo6_01480 [Arthrobacter sp. Hiyo6]|nr:hypothetical protein AHiyo6_01480 [Arthrobacter sp. Hiyo6]
MARGWLDVPWIGAPVAVQDESKAEVSGTGRITQARNPSRSALRKPLLVAALLIGALTVAATASAAWLGLTASTIKNELQSATQLLPQLKDDVSKDDVSAATKTVDALKAHTAKAREAAGDPLWMLAGALPWLGPNFQAASEVATSADDVATLGAAPLVSVFQSLDWKTLTPNGAGVNLDPLVGAKPKLVSAAHAVKESSDRLNGIDANALIPQVAEPLIQARTQLSSLRTGLDTAADAATIAPNLLGAHGPRRYLLLIQNNAETRATGGIPAPWRNSQSTTER